MMAAPGAHSLHRLDKRTCLKWTTGDEVGICVCNDYWFENTHVKPWEAGWGALNRVNSCCKDFECRGGVVTGHGDSNLKVGCSFLIVVERRIHIANRQHIGRHRGLWLEGLVGQLLVGEWIVLAENFQRRQRSLVL